MTDTPKTWFGALSLPLKLGILVITGLVAMNGVLGTYSQVTQFIAHRKDAVTDARIKASDERIATAEAEKAVLLKQIEDNKKAAVALRVEIEAKDQLINQASIRIQASDKKIEEIISEFSKETDRIAALDDVAVEAELRRRLTEAGRLR